MNNPNHRMTSPLIPLAALTMIWGSPFAGDTENIPHQFFGMHIHWNDQNHRPSFPAIGSLRLWDTRTNWSNLEPAKGHWDFEKLDRLVEYAKANNADILYTFGSTPSWASARPNENGPYGPGTGAPPRDLGDWDNYVRKVAGRYKGKINYYELLNEPVFIEHEGRCSKGMHFWCGSADDMVELARRTNQVLKEIDPDIKLVAPGFAGATAGREELFLAHGGAKYVDIIAHHFYAKNPRQMLERIDMVRKVMKNSGAEHYELWNTESGYTLGESYARQQIAGVPNLSSEKMSAYVAQSLILAASAGVRRTFWYAWDSDITGMSKNFGTQPVEGGRAYSEIMRWIVDNSIRKCDPDIRGIWICEIAKGNATSWIVWNENDVASFEIPASWDIDTVHFISGEHKVSYSGQVLSVGGEPVLLSKSLN